MQVVRLDQLHAVSHGYFITFMPRRIPINLRRYRRQVWISEKKSVSYSLYKIFTAYDTEDSWDIGVMEQGRSIARLIVDLGMNALCKADLELFEIDLL